MDVKDVCVTAKSWTTESSHAHQGSHGSSGSKGGRGSSRAVVETREGLVFFFSFFLFFWTLILTVSYLKIVDGWMGVQGREG